MNQNLKEAKQAIRTFIRLHWSDEKLAEVYCFNQDGKMTIAHPCCCIVGVTGSTQLHQSKDECKDGPHYTSVMCELDDSSEAENAYADLAYLSANSCDEGHEWIKLRRDRLSAILRAEMRRRASLQPQKILAVREEVKA